MVYKGYFESYILPNSNNCFHQNVGWLCWGLTSQSTIFQSYRDGAIASWVSNQYFRGVKCLAQGHNTAAVGFEPRTSRSGVRHSTTEPPRSPDPSKWPRIAQKLKIYQSFYLKVRQTNCHFSWECSCRTAEEVWKNTNENGMPNLLVFVLVSMSNHLEYIRTYGIWTCWFYPAKVYSGCIRTA